MHIGEEVGQLASQKICHVSQRFCEAWPSNQIQLKSCCWMEKLSSTMDCSRLCTAAAGHLEIVISGTGISYWQSCACITDNSSPPIDDAVPMHPRSPVLYIQYCAPMSRTLQEDRENEICRWHFFTGLTEVCVHAYPHSYSLFFILCEDSTLGWWW
jgi:hypothetical protein